MKINVESSPKLVELHDIAEGGLFLYNIGIPQHPPQWRFSEGSDKVEDKPRLLLKTPHRVSHQNYCYEVGGTYETFLPDSTGVYRVEEISVKI